MKKYKRNSRKNVSVFIFFFLFVLITIPFLVYLSYFTGSEKPLLENKISYSIDNFNFEGTLESTYKLNDDISQVVYKINDKLESHFVNFKTGDEEKYNVFIKEKKGEEFNNKVLELLKLKYSKDYVEKLISSEKKFFLKDDYLYISFENVKLPREKSYSLKVYYNEIKDYLSFSPNIITDYKNEDGFEYDPNKTSIIVTYDDGPNGSRTSTLIDALEDYKMSATFFMQGSKLNNDSTTVLKVYNSHSEVGYHSYAHKYFTKQKSEEIKSEFAISDEAFNKITGDHLKLTRPPYGNYNDMVLNSINNSFIRWNIDTNDWRYKDVNHISNEILNNISDGNIILMHDSYNTSVEASISVFKKLYDKNIQVLSVSDYAKLKGIDLKNHEVYFNLKK